jgi:polyhydroxyalkanoate synthesis regulator phasin
LNLQARPEAPTIQAEIEQAVGDLGNFYETALSSVRAPNSIMSNGYLQMTKAGIFRGSGKTRLALEVGTRQLAHFALICLILADTVQFVTELPKIPLDNLKGVTMRTLLEKGFLAGLGLLSMTREKAQKVVEELTHEGELQKGEMKQWVDQLSDRGEEERQALRKLIRDEMKKVLDEVGFATKEDIQKLLDKQN